MKTCDECGGKHYAKGKCRIHYKMPSQLNPKPIKTSNKALQSTKKPKPINKVSQSQLKRLQKYKGLRDEYMDNHKVCEAQIDEKCTYFSTQLHHKGGRDGDNLFNYFMACCENCHHRIEIGGEWVYEQGFKLKRTEL